MKLGLDGYGLVWIGLTRSRLVVEQWLSSMSGVQYICVDGYRRLKPGVIKYIKVWTGVDRYNQV